MSIILSSGRSSGSNSERSSGCGRTAPEAMNTMVQHYTLYESMCIGMKQRQEIVNVTIQL